ncbi:type II CRISPR-associated endonuclease Cas1 [Nesterenkonia sp.]|uniref:type II CRISPR-associated endonuclease Cas1 n=1 Tax=Nesterenkonia sp. TaxID=704201 RepID=UPI00261AA2FB|nr:type II CRISPR-associated endonuclease Cas1 [Nesterenkonia sp.]
MAAWQVLDLLNFEGKVRTERGAFSIEGRRVPLDSLSTALIGPKCAISPGVPHHAAKHDVVVLFCDWRGQPLSALMPWSDNTRTGARMQAQAALSEPRRKNAWMRVIKAKIASQGKTLEMAGNVAEAKRLYEMSRKVRSGDPENLEGQAARLFWSGLYGHLNFTRIPGANDALNAAHNYGYTILRGRVLTSILGAGLTAGIGIFHRGRSNPFALADDLIEPFRAVIDRAILAFDPRELLLDQQTKKALIHAVRPPDSSEEGFRADAEIDRFTSAFAQYVEGGAEYLDVPKV